MITKRGFMKWLLSTSTLISSGTFLLAPAAAKSMPCLTYTPPLGVKRFTVRMMGGGGGGGGGGSAGQNLTGGRGGVQ